MFDAQICSTNEISRSIEICGPEHSLTSHVSVHMLEAFGYKEFRVLSSVERSTTSSGTHPQVWGFQWPVSEFEYTNTTPALELRLYPSSLCPCSMAHDMKLHITPFSEA